MRRIDSRGGPLMESNEGIVLDRDQRVALLLHVNQRLYQKGEISKEVYEEAKEKILLVNL